MFYSENTKEEFSSFDRLKLHNAGASEPVESVLCKYELLIVPPGLGKSQTYQISIRVSSRLAALLRIIRGADVSRLLRIMGQRVISVEISYVDYSIARTLLNIVDDWVKTIPKAIENKLITKIQSYSHWIPRIVRLFTILIAGFVAADAVEYFLRAAADLKTFGFLTVYVGVMTYVIYQIMGWLAMFAENSIDEWTQPSYIKLNRADEVAIAKNEEDNKKAIAKTALSVALSVLIGVSTKLTAMFIFEHFSH